MEIKSTWTLPLAAIWSVLPASVIFGALVIAAVKAVVPLLELDSGFTELEEVGCEGVAAARFGMLPETSKPFKSLRDWLK